MAGAELKRSTATVQPSDSGLVLQSAIAERTSDARATTDSEDSGLAFPGPTAIVHRSAS